MNEKFIKNAKEKPFFIRQFFQWLTIFDACPVVTDSLVQFLKKKKTIFESFDLKNVR